MKSNSRGFGWLLFALLLLVFIVLVFTSAVTNNETVKQYRDDIKDRADALRKAILKQEGVVNGIRTELHSIRSIQGYLLKKAKRICMAIKCVGLVIVAGIIIMAHAIFNLNPTEFLLTFCSMSAFVYGTITGVVLNEVRGINDALRLLQNLIVQRTYAWYSFQPSIIELLEQKLVTEEQKLNLLRAEYAQMNNLN